jgi:dTDP-4-amino-4,6-dideoxygalactose transaminase
MKSRLSRRRFLAASAGMGVGLAVTGGARASEKPALLGGDPIRKTPFPSWPVFDESDEKAFLAVLKSGKWFRGYGQNVNRFEEAYAKLTGAKHCLATANGTSSLLASLGGLGIGAGDEVIVPPYTFIATVNAVLILNALPVFVDTDRETFQIDAGKIEAAITDRTRAILPVHLGGSVADMDAILAVARKHKLPVVEDTCQSHLAEWKGRKAGTLGDAGCFSFQASKNLNSGEGGAVLSDNPELIERCYAFHNNSRGGKIAGYDFTYSGRGVNLRMTEFQAALLMTQMTRIEEQARTRTANAQALTKMLGEIPGILPARMYPGCTRNAYHLYMFRYQKEQFGGMPRATFLKALDREGIPCMAGYSPLNKEAFLKATFESRGFQAIYPRELIAKWEERSHCPQNDQLCQEAVWLFQSQLLGQRSDMEEIAAAVRKIQAHAGELAKA